jgi:flavin reductase (DIM6/NTAB) family NADH-FMN oxidoreductase RutF
MTTTQAGPEASTSLDPDVFRAALRRHPAGVTVVTLDAGSGPVGFTATSVVSASLDPPLLTFSIAPTASSWPALSVAENVVVNLLAHDQHDIATRFATSGIDRFGHPTRWTRLRTGEPLLVDAPTWIRCEVERRIPIGDHVLVVAQSLEAEASRPAAPLVYHDRHYHTVDTGPA